MADEELHVNDEGTMFIFTVVEDGEPLDISSATTKDIILARKDKSYFTVDGSFLTSGSDGKLYYITEDDPAIDMKGDWKAQLYLEMPGGKWHTSIAQFSVGENLDDQ